jgi:hypothetical protein
MLDHYSCRRRCDRYRRVLAAPLAKNSYKNA